MSMQGIESENLNNRPLVLQEFVTQVLGDYFARLDGTLPADFYELVLREVEKPLLEQVLNYVKGNQTKAALVLHMNRGTLRKKMKFYGLMK